MASRCRDVRNAPTARCWWKTHKGSDDRTKRPLVTMGSITSWPAECNARMALRRMVALPHPHDNLVG